MRTALSVAVLYLLFTLAEGVSKHSLHSDQTWIEITSSSDSPANGTLGVTMLHNHRYHALISQVWNSLGYTGCQLSVKKNITPQEQMWSSPCLGAYLELGTTYTCSLSTTKDGDLVLALNTMEMQQKWHSATSSQNGTWLLLSPDGELVINDSSNVTLWHSLAYPASSLCFSQA